MIYIWTSVFCMCLLYSQGFEVWDQQVLQDHQEGPLDCRPPYGCFPLGPPWVSRERPVSLPPLPLSTIIPRFRVFTLGYPQGLVMGESNVSTLTGLPLSPDLRLVFVAHGFIESGDTPWVRTMVKTLLKTQHPAVFSRSANLNRSYADKIKLVVVVVDWRDGAMPPYAQAVANIRLVGAVIGQLIITMQQVLQLPGSSFHLVGHSLGSHLMGYAGSFVSQHSVRSSLVGRITALDPAGPYFRDADPLVRLDPTDAEFVDVLHTDDNEIVPGIPVSLGNPDPLGHVDFYPNGGGLQPGCSSSLGEEMVIYNKDFASGFLGFMGCHHQRSIHYYLESIVNSCSFLAVECPSWEDYKNGNCWDCSRVFCSHMGFYSTPEENKIKMNRSNPPKPTNYTAHQNMGMHTGIKDAVESAIAAVRATFYDVVKHIELNESEVLVYNPGGEDEIQVDSLDVRTVFQFLDEMAHLAQNLSHFRQKRENANMEMSRKMFLMTRHTYPHCGSQLRVTVLTSTSEASQSHGGDVTNFNLVLRGTAGTAFVKMPAQGTMFLTPGESVSLVTATEGIGQLLELDVEYTEPDDLLHSIFLWRFETPVVHLESFMFQDLTTGGVTIFPVVPEKFALGDSRTLRPAS